MADIEPTAQQSAPQGETAPNPVINASEPGTEQTATPPEQPAEPTTEQPPGEQRDEKPAVPKWAQRRFAELTKARSDAERERDAYRQMVEAMRDGGQPETPAATAPDEIDRLATQRAQEIVRQQTFDAQCNDAYAAGQKEFGPEFEAALGNLRMAGVLTPQLIEVALATDAPAKALFELGSNPDRIESVVNLAPHRMAIEIDRIARAAPASKPVSNAPPPLKPVTGSAKAETAMDDMSIAEWMAARNKQVGRR